MAISTAAAAPLTEDRVLLLYNSASADSRAVHDLYLAAHPGVLEFDLADPTLAPANRARLGDITRAEFESRIRAPLRSYLAGVDAAGRTRAQRVIAIATTRGLPARIIGADEFTLHSTFSSLESELTLLQQSLISTPAAPPFQTAVAGSIDNPYHGRVGQPITAFDRAGIQSPESFGLARLAAWRAPDLTPGDMYLVCRLDSAPGPEPGVTALDNIAALITRSQTLTLDPARAQAILDEWSPAFDQLDDDGGLFFSTADDFTAASEALSAAGVRTTHDETFAFIPAAATPDPQLPIVLLATYGENHAAGGFGADPPGVGDYLALYPHIHPAGVFIAYESFNGNSLITGAQRGGQQQALDFIARGGSFTVAHVAEPFSYSVADTEMLVKNLLLGGMTFAEAAYSAIPTLSWQSTPIGDPLARVHLTTAAPAPADLTGDGVVDGADLATVLSVWGAVGSAIHGDVNGDGVVDGADLALILTSWTG